MKLAIVSLMTGVPWGGSEELWAAGAHAARTQGIEVEAFLPAWSTVPEKVQQLCKNGVSVSYWRRFESSLKARLAAKLHPSSSLDRQIRQSAADAFVVSLGSAFDLAGYPRLGEFLRSMRKPYVLVVQHNYETPPRPWEKERVAGVYERAASLVFVSHRNKGTAERQLARRLANAVVLQNPVNLAAYEPVPWPQKSDRTAMACVARLDVWAKGQDLLFEALAEWRQRDWHLTLFGEGPDREYLAALAEMYGIADRIVLAGHAMDIRDVWAEQEMLVLPSRSEGTPLALVEAQLAGRPAVVTDVGDCAGWSVDGETGFVAEAATAKSLGRALSRAWDRRSEWAAMGQRAHEAAANRLDRNPGETLLKHVLAACGR